MPQRRGQFCMYILFRDAITASAGSLFSSAKQSGAWRTAAWQLQNSFLASQHSIEGGGAARRRGPVNREEVAMKLTTLEKLLEDQLKDLYSAEAQLLKALPKMAKQASTPSLRDAIEHHLEETQAQYDRLQQIGDAMGVKLTGKKCKAMEGLIEEGKEALDADGDEPIIDAAIIAAAQRVEHYEIGGYGTARTLAEQLGKNDVAGLLQQSLEEEEAADKKLTSVAVEDIYPNLMAEQKQEGNGEEEEAKAGRGRRRQMAGQR
jgi:ferritin-like metal-binding protein YciE